MVSLFEAYWRKRLSDELLESINRGSEINAYGAYLTVRGKVGRRLSLRNVGFRLAVLAFLLLGISIGVAVLLQRLV